MGHAGVALHGCLARVSKLTRQGPEAADFYRFLKSMETYRKIINEDATIVLSTSSDLFALLRHIEQKVRD
jgi:membrane protease subunit HflC